MKSMEAEGSHSFQKLEVRGLGELLNLNIVILLFYGLFPFEKLGEVKRKAKPTSALAPAYDDMSSISLNFICYSNGIFVKQKNPGGIEM
ncbi:hypothetical protein D5086_003030 [Populus alba]|uniref:Uncharacterized protein n=1 Tax=Populus alba TaxID=43335 RepID=A0ACC4D4C6_POPAL